MPVASCCNCMAYNNKEEMCRENPVEVKKKPSDWCRQYEVDRNKTHPPKRKS
jgi:hypothetical protein